MPLSLDEIDVSILKSLLKDVGNHLDRYQEIRE